MGPADRGRAQRQPAEPHAALWAGLAPTSKRPSTRPGRAPAVWPPMCGRSKTAPCLEFQDLPQISRFVSHLAQCRLLPRACITPTQ